MKSLVESWDNYIDENLKLLIRNEPVDPAEFNRRLESTVFEAFNHARGLDPTELNSPAKLMKVLREKGFEDRQKAGGGTIVQVRGMFSGQYEQLMTLSNERKQHDWAHFRENARNLLFRVLTSVFIAGVVLGTYALGDALGIPMPLRMPL